jgi:hypothetical protein
MVERDARPDDLDVGHGSGSGRGDGAARATRREDAGHQVRMIRSVGIPDGRAPALGGSGAQGPLRLLVLVPLDLASRQASFKGLEPELCLEATAGPEDGTRQPGHRYEEDGHSTDEHHSPDQQRRSVH